MKNVLSEPKVYLVPTPIGNIEDITFRAVKVLKSVDLILAEDTRNSAKLLKIYDIHTPMQAYHMHNEHQKTDIFIQKVKGGASLAVITDGGSPGISDPGFLMVKTCIENNIPFETLPGATAFVPALINSGFPNHEFLFVGFLPAKKGRQTKIQYLSEEKKTIILYESPHRIAKLLSQLLLFFDPSTPISISREISKMYEETIRGQLEEIYLKLLEHPLKGEIVLVINNN